MANKEANKEQKVKKHFLKDFKVELKKVIWPTPKQLVNNTIAVISIVLITAVIVFVLDVVFDLMNKYGISNLQNYVKETFATEEKDDEVSSESSEKENSENNAEQENSTENNTSETENTESNTETVE